MSQSPNTNQSARYHDIAHNWSQAGLLFVILSIVLRVLYTHLELAWLLNVEWVVLAILLVCTVCTVVYSHKSKSARNQ